MTETVWVVTYTHWDESDTLGVFTDRTKAKIHVSDLMETGDFPGFFSILSYALDEGEKPF